MANLTETTTYDAGIYQLEQNDSVDAGTGGSGIANSQAKSLANRTNYLKAHVDALEAAGFKFKSIGAAATTATLVAAACGTLINCAMPDDSQVLTLPQGSACPNGSVIGFYISGTGVTTILPHAGDVILITFPGNLSLNPGEWIFFFLDSGAWIPFSQNLAINQVYPGDIKAAAIAGASAGWLECDGSAISRSVYAALFNVIGTTWGAGNGTTTFNIPDFRGEFLRGWDHGRGVDSGRSFASAQADQLQGHYHLLAQAAGYGSGSGTELMSESASTSKTINQAQTIITDGTNGTPRVGAETRPRNKSIMYCIKF